MYLVKNKGITMIEILVVIAVIGIISSVVFISLSAFRNEQALKNTTIDVVSLLDKARQNTLSSVNSTNYSVHFESNKAVLFTGEVYSISDITNETIYFSPTVAISIPLVLNIGGGSDVTFERLTGDTIGGTIVIHLVSDKTKTKVISISKTGIASSN